MRFVKGKTKMVKYPNAITNVYLKGALVYFNGSGAVIPADSTSGDHVGITMEAIPATDARYTTAGKILVEVPIEKDVEFESAVTADLAASSVGVAMDLTDSVTVDATTPAKFVVTCVGFISATKGRFVLNAHFEHYRVATT